MANQTIQEKIGQDLKEAVLSKNEDTRNLLKVVIGEFNREPVKVIPDDKALAILKKMHFNASEQKNSIEMSILEKYIPQQLNEVELQAIIEDISTKNNYITLKDMGKIMSELKANYAGKYDGKLANDLVKKILK